MRVMTTSTVRVPQTRLTQGGATLSATIVCFAMVLLYAIAMALAYEILATWWAYFGFTYRLTDSAPIYAACVLAAVPSVLLTHRAKNFAQGAAWIIYLLVFLPSMIVPVMQYSSNAEKVMEVFLITWISCVVFLLLCRRNVLRVELPRINPRVFWWSIGALWLAMLLLILVGFGSTFRFVGLQDLYTQRFEGADVAGRSALIRYSIAILGSAIDPFLIAYGLYSRRYWISGIGMFGQIILFGTMAARAVLLSPLFVVAVWFMKDELGRMRGQRFLLGLFVLVALTFPFLMTYNPIAGGINDLLTLVYLRTLLISGSMFGVYEQFFSLGDLTYYSHTNIGALFVEYPFGSISVGQAVMQYLVPATGLDLGEANANFLATDGIAALGVAGIPVATLITGFILLGMSKLVPPRRTMLMIAAGTGFILSLANTSVLTSLITGGGLLLTLIIAVAPESIEK